MAKYIITVTPPTPNGDLHLGHLSGPFLAADVMRRFLIAQCHDVIMVCYSDDYQSYLPRKAEALERTPADYSFLMQRAITLSCDLAGIDFDIFPRTKDNPLFEESVNHYLDCISDDLITEEVQVNKCLSCTKWGHEAWGRGGCDKCNESSDASQCENCAAKPTPELMTNMTCMNCGSTMKLTTQSAEVWHLGRHFAQLAEQHNHRGMRDDLRLYLNDILTKTSDTWPITRPGDAGLPVARFQDAPVHTWFMGISGYRAAVKAYLEYTPQRGSFADWWSPQTEIIHFLGFDCSYSHAVAYGVQQICDPNGPNVGRFITNRFLKLDGDDFSTSRGNAVWIKDLTGLYPLDACRLFIALHAPEVKSVNFSLSEFKTWMDEVYYPLQSTLKKAKVASKITHRWRNNTNVKTYNSYASCDMFSIQKMAYSMMALFDEIQAAPLAEQPAGYRMLACLAEPLTPTLYSLLIEGKTHESV